MNEDVSKFPKVQLKVSFKRFSLFPGRQVKRMLGPVRLNDSTTLLGALEKSDCRKPIEWVLIVGSNFFSKFPLLKKMLDENRSNTSSNLCSICRLNVGQKQKTFKRDYCAKR